MTCISEYKKQLEFYSSSSGNQYADVETAIEMFAEVRLSPRDLAYQVKEFADSTGTKLEDVDACYVAYDHILQMARDKIIKVLDFDIVNDITDGTEFYTCGSGMDTSFDYSQKAKDQLVKELINEDVELCEVGKVLRDDFVKVFLEYVDIDTTDIRMHRRLKK